MKKIMLITVLTLMGWAFNCNAQSLYPQPPYWVKNTPIPQSGNFYYRVTIAEGKNYRDVYAESFAKAIYESYSKLVGISVNINDNESTIKDDVLQSISSNSGQMRLPINKVCEYREDLITSNGIRLYVLWQVANSALVDPQFEFFNKCE